MGSDEKVWFVTGTSTGFGRLIAQEALAAGDRVVATARDPRSLDDLVAAAPDRVRAVALDVTDPAAVTAAVAEAVDAFGRIDVLVNNAGYGLRGAIEEFTDDQLRQVFETNVFGLLAVTRAVLPTMRAQGSGLIVQMSSVGGVTSRLGSTAYAGTKFAVEGLSEGLATEVAHLGIKVVICEPGPFRTDFAGRSIRWSEPMDAYAPVLGPERERFAAEDGRQPGDPLAAAKVIVGLAREEDPPLRLPMGGAAFRRIREHLTTRLADLDAVAPLGLELDYT
ncbi:MAG: SDR family NAD(P)-dependent oxidoreductase [Pseudonocardiaceae bacterium]|nr:MAG: SDR family NAD(P)-dependent oxidoreductase [Pseudonocardiaceae bacterium]